MTYKRQLCAFLLAASAAACTSAKVGYDYDPGANFSAYRTYEWIADKQEATGDKRVDNSQVDIRIRTAIGAQLRQKGYMTSTNKQPDFYVAYHLGLKDLSTDTSTQYFSEGMAGKPFTQSADTRTLGKPQSTVTEIEAHITGSLLVDIIDAATKKLVWRGTAAGEVDPGLTSEERDERMRTIIREMFAHFPPK